MDDDRWGMEFIISAQKMSSSQNIRHCGGSYRTAERWSTGKDQRKECNSTYKREVGSEGAAWILARTVFYDYVADRGTNTKLQKPSIQSFGSNTD